MFYNYSFFKSLFQPTPLMAAIANDSEIRGYKARFITVLLLTLALFALQNIWGMGTAGLSYLFATNDSATYFAARIISFISALGYGALFFIFHYLIVSFILASFTELPKKTVRKVQLFIVSTFLLEKVLLFLTFYIVGYTTNLNFFSLAPIVAQITTEPIVLFTLNQLSIFTVLAVIIQYYCLKRLVPTETHKKLLAQIIAIYVICAILIGLLSTVPFQEWLVRGLA